MNENLIISIQLPRTLIKVIDVNFAISFFHMLSKPYAITCKKVVTNHLIDLKMDL